MSDRNVLRQRPFKINVAAILLAAAAPALAACLLAGMVVLRSAQPMPTPTLVARLPTAGAPAQLASPAVTKPASSTMSRQPPSPTGTGSPPPAAAVAGTPQPASTTPASVPSLQSIPHTPSPEPAVAAATAAWTETAQPTETSTANVTATSSPTAVPPLAVRRDLACLDGAGRIYIYGEIVNVAAGPYRAALTVQVFGANGMLPAASPVFDMPGRFVVPAGQALPFVFSAGLGQAAFTRYSLEVAGEQSETTPAGTVRLDDFITEAEPDLVTVTGHWTNTGGAPLSEYVDVYAAAYDAQGRVTNLQYETITAQVNLTPGQHSFQLFLDPTAPCGPGAVQAGAIGE